MDYIFLGIIAALIIYYVISMLKNIGRSTEEMDHKLKERYSQEISEEINEPKK